MIRILCLMAGLFGAGSLSQFPEFSQQYLQRLGGHVDELSRDLKQLDAMALDLRMGREDRLEQMENTPSFAVEATYWRNKIARHARLSGNLRVLQNATPMARLTMPLRFADKDIARAVWEDFTPAVPITTAGAVSASMGFFVGWGALAMLLAFVAAPFRSFRRKTKKGQPYGRRDPMIAKPSPAMTVTTNRPRLAGVKR